MSCDSSHAARSLIAGGKDDAAWLNSDIYIRCKTFKTIHNVAQPLILQCFTVKGSATSPLTPTESEINPHQVIL